MPAPVSPARRSRAARIRREGGTQAKAARAIGCNVRTIQRLEAQDEQFQNLIRGRGVLVAGPLRVQVHESDVLEDTDAAESILWIASGAPLETAPEVLGSLIVSDATHCRAIFVPPADVERVRADVLAHRFPILEDAPSTPLVHSALPALQDPQELQTLCTICTAPPAEAFTEFLRLWRYKSQELKEVRVLGEDLWQAQRILIDTISTDDHLMILKSRKLGLSTVCVAYCGFVLRFRDRNARVHLFSRAERAALDLAAAVKFGLTNLPKHLQLPIERETMKQIVFGAGQDDQRELVAYPTSDATAVEALATHSMVDEAADIPRWNLVFSGLEPTMSAVGSTSHVVFTGAGPANPTSEHFKRAQAGDTLHKALFIDALQRPDRDEAWLERKRSQMLSSQFRVEYPSTVEDALSGTIGHVFAAEYVDASHEDAANGLILQPGEKFYCEWHPDVKRYATQFERCRGTYGKQCRAPLRRVPYVIGVDVGGSGANADASVLTVLDGAGEMLVVPEQRRLQGIPFPRLQAEIQRLANEYRNATVAIEMNGVGAALRGNLEIPDSRIVEYWQTQRSKERAIGKLALALEDGRLKFDHNAIPNLRTELLAYLEDDEYCVQDAVMSLAIAIDSVTARPQRGVVGKILYAQSNPYL